MPKSKKSHKENLACVCCVCGRKKNSFSNVTDDLAKKVKLLQPNYDRHGGIHPTAICPTCRKASREMEKDPKQTRNRVPGLLDYSTLKPPGVITSENPDCGCSICSIGRLSMIEEKKHNKKISNPIGRPAAGQVKKMQTVQFNSISNSAK